MDPESHAPRSLTAEEQYTVIRSAVEDAIIAAIGALVQVGIGLVLAWFGVVVGVSSYDTNPVQGLAGVFVVLVGLYFVGTALGWFPALQTWLSTDRNR